MRPDLSRVASFYHLYINLVPETGLKEAFASHSTVITQLLASLPAGKYDYRYAPGKWTLKEVVQHLIDAERVFAYRALNFARRNPTPLPGFDENEFAANARAGDRPWADLTSEFNTLRASSALMFSAFDENELEAGGIANNSATYVRALAYTLLGHVTHHVNIIKERYL